MPYTTPIAQLYVPPGGTNLIVMRGPDVQEMPGRGVYLEVVKSVAYDEWKANAGKGGLPAK